MPYSTHLPINELEYIYIYFSQKQSKNKDIYKIILRYF